MCLDAWPTKSGTIRRCGLVGVGVDFLEEVRSSSWLPLYQDVEVSAPSAPCLPAAAMLPVIMD